MKTLFFDCSMGAAGDMLAAALLELIEDKDKFINELNRIGIPNVQVKAEKCLKCGIVGTSFKVKIGETEESEDIYSHHHSSLHNITHIIENLRVSRNIKKNIISVYNIIAQAESIVHGIEVSQIHFHEIGSMDALADIAAVCLLIDKLKVEKIVASAVNMGSGFVKCAHGILPVPAPATAEILKGVPSYCDLMIKSELCTPTGAALLKFFADEFEAMPVLKPEKIGYGMGKKDFEKANCVRAFLGEGEEENQTVCILSCNLDDMTAEEISFACNMLFKAGALDVYTTSAGMKKSRSGIILSVMCKQADKKEMLKLIFKHTSTIGVRERIEKRYTLERKIETLHTSLGDIEIKRSSGYGTKKEKLEHSDLAALAEKSGMSLKEVGEAINNEIKFNQTK